MKVLVLAEQNACEKVLDSLSGLDGDTVLIHGQNALNMPANPTEADVIIGCSPEHMPGSSILAWRCHQHTYLIPCWFPAERKSLGGACLWPALAIDRFDPECGVESFSEWLSEVSQWQQNRLHCGEGANLTERGGLELATALSLRKATGVLSVFDDDGKEGRFSIREGDLVYGSFKHLRGSEAFYEFLCMQGGRYEWNGGETPRGDAPRPLSLLLSEGLKVIGEANFVYHFLSSPYQQIRATDSQSALDDSAAEDFKEQLQIYGLIERGATFSQIVARSPLSRASTMSLLAKWFSLADITAGAEEMCPQEDSVAAGEHLTEFEAEGAVAEQGATFEEASVVAECRREPVCSVLIVDDSPLICNVLRSMFESDPRMSVAGVAHDGLEALGMIGKQKPDVITLDLQMPRMDGLTALKHIMIRDPLPVVVVSALTEATSRLTYEAFKYGAVEVMQKPPNAARQASLGENADFCDRIVQASRVQIAAARYVRRREKAGPGLSSASPEEFTEEGEKVLLLICGAGGIPPLLKFIFALRPSRRLPPTVIAVDSPLRVTEALIANLRKDTFIPLEGLSRVGALSPGCCHVISNEERYHFFMEGNRVKVTQNGLDAAPNDFFDTLLESAADCLKSRLRAIALSGAGEDGVAGMLRVKETGGEVFALTPGECLRPELPERLIGLGYAQEIKDIGNVLERIDTRTARAYPGRVGQGVKALSDSDLS